MDAVRVEIILSALVAVSALTSILLTVISLKMQRDHSRKNAKPIPRPLSTVRTDMTRIGIANHGPGVLIIKSKKYFFNEEEFEKFNDLWQKYFENKHPDDTLKGYSLKRQPLPTVLTPGGRINMVILEPKELNDLDAYFECRISLLKKMSQLRFEYTYTDIYDSEFPSQSIDEREFFCRKLRELNEKNSTQNNFSEVEDGE